MNTGFVVDEEQFLGARWRSMSMEGGDHKLLCPQSLLLNPLEHDSQLSRLLSWPRPLPRLLCLRQEPAAQGEGQRLQSREVPPPTQLDSSRG